MTDQRTDENELGLTEGLDGEALPSEDVGVPEQPPMDDAAGGPSVSPPEEQVADERGDFA